MAETKTNAVRMVERQKIPHEIRSYETEDHQIDGLSVAQKLGQDPSSVFKTLVTRGTGRNLYVFVIPVTAELDLKKAAKCAGEKSVEMVKVSELLALTGYIRGGCSPVGMKKLYPTFFHKSALEQEKIAVSAGRIGLQMLLEPQALAQIVQGTFADLIQEP